MSFAAIIKILHIYLLASIKYFLTFPYALLIGMNLAQTLILVTLGGLSGFFFFYYFSGYLISYYYKHHETLSHHLKYYIRVDLLHLLKPKANTGHIKINRRSRMIVKLRRKYGFWGIIIMTPALLSIPIGAFLLRKYYGGHKNAIAYMTLSILAWGLIFSTLFIIIPKAA